MPLTRTEEQGLAQGRIRTLAPLCAPAASPSAPAGPTDAHTTDQDLGQAHVPEFPTLYVLINEWLQTDGVAGTSPLRNVHACENG
jgi:hypothetical protein